MARGDRTCLICGKQYKYCGTCPEAKPSETWKALYCSQACRRAFDTLSKFVNGHITANVAYDSLSVLDIDKTNLNEQIKEDWERVKKERTVQFKEKNIPAPQQNNSSQKKNEPFKKKN